MIVAAFAALLLSAGQQTTAPTATPPAAAPAAPPAAAPTPPTTPEAAQVCRRQPVEGSRRQERVCHTKAEWDVIRENARGNRDNASRNQRDGF